MTTPQTNRIAAPDDGGKTTNPRGISTQVWLALIGIIPATLTAVAGYRTGQQDNAKSAQSAFVAGREEGHKSGVDEGHKAGLDEGRKAVVEAAPKAPTVIESSDESAELNKVYAEFVRPVPSSQVVLTNPIRCGGPIRNFQPGKHHLWMAVEVNGYIWFKDKPFTFSDNDTRWSYEFDEGGDSKEMTLLLFIADTPTHDAIWKWLDAGVKGKDKFPPFTSIGNGAHRIDHCGPFRFQKTP